MDIREWLISIEQTVSDLEMFQGAPISDDEERVAYFKQHAEDVRSLIAISKLLATKLVNSGEISKACNRSFEACVREYHDCVDCTLQGAYNQIKG